MPGTIDAGTIDAGTIDAGTIDAGTIGVGTIGVGTIGVGTVGMGTVDAGTIEERHRRATSSDDNARRHSLRHRMKIAAIDVRIPPLDLDRRHEVDKDGSSRSDASQASPGPEKGTSLEESRSSHFTRAAIVGGVAGLLAVAFQHALSRAEHLREVLVSRCDEIGERAILIGGIAAACAFVAHMTGRYCPEAAGSGIPHVKGVLLGLYPMRSIRILFFKFVGGVIGIGSGLSLGREGPTIQLGAAMAERVARIMHVPKSSVSRVISCGAGAGLAAAFNAPLAGFVFVLEELRREVSTRTYGSALIATLIADIVARTLNGQLPIFRIPLYPTPPLIVVPWAAVLGVVTGMVGTVFARGILGAKAYTKSERAAPSWLRGAVAGLLVGLAAFLVPAAIGGGHHTAERLLSHESASTFTLAALAILVGVKLFLTIISYATGAPGGFFMPMLVLGAGTGLFVGESVAHFQPDHVRFPAAFAVMGMASMFSGVVRAPLTGIVLIVEMTGNYEQTFALSIACLTSYLVSERFGPPPIYEALLHTDTRGSAPVVTEAGEPVIFHRVVEAGAPLDGVVLAKAGLPDGCLIVAVCRNGIIHVPDGRTTLLSGDELTISVSTSTQETLLRLDAAVRSD